MMVGKERGGWQTEQRKEERMAITSCPQDSKKPDLITSTFQNCKIGRARTSQSLEHRKGRKKADGLPEKKGSGPSLYFLEYSIWIISIRNMDLVSGLVLEQNFAAFYGLAGLTKQHTQDKNSTP